MIIAIGEHILIRRAKPVGKSHRTSEGGLGGGGYPALPKIPLRVKTNVMHILIYRTKSHRISEGGRGGVADILPYQKEDKQPQLWLKRFLRR